MATTETISNNKTEKKNENWDWNKQQQQKHDKTTEKLQDDYDVTCMIKFYSL